MYVENKRKYPDEEEPPTSSRGAVEPFPLFSALKSRWRVTMPKFRYKKVLCVVKVSYVKVSAVSSLSDYTVRATAVCCLAQNFCHIFKLATLSQTGIN